MKSFLTLLIFLLCQPAQAQKMASMMAVRDSMPPFAYRQITTNNIHMWMSSDGMLSNSEQRYKSVQGMTWPGDNGFIVMWGQGLVISARDANTSQRYLTGCTYNSGLQPGPVLADGTAGNPLDERYRVYCTRKMTREEFQRLPGDEGTNLRRDFIEWPTDLGAPWHDGDGDGQYSPDFDAFLDGDPATDTPLMPGREVYWFVSNDLDSSRCADFFGSVPVGFEIRTLVWASPGDTVLNNTVFAKRTIINRSNILLDSVYIGRYSDPDISDAYTDRVGVDTALAMSYAYNGFPTDWRDGRMPAVGEVWLQTPVVPLPGATAKYNFGLRTGYRNLPLHAFVYFSKDGPNPFPAPHMPEHAIRMHFSLRGLYHDGMPMEDPMTGKTTTLAFAGDPVNNTGWHDSLSLGGTRGGRRHMVSSVGPITLAPGDTQEVVIATTIGMGADHLDGITELRRNARVLRALYGGTLGKARVLSSTHTLTFPATDNFHLVVHAEVEGASAVTALLQAADETVLASFALYDDGAHDDGTSGDGVYGGSLDHETVPVGGDLYIEASPADGQSSVVLSARALPLPGPITLTQTGILSDHLNFDFRANPGEHCRFDVELMNRTRFSLGGFRLQQMDGIQVFEEATLDSLLAAGSNMSLDDQGHFLTVHIPVNAVPGSRVHLPLRIIGKQNCIWLDTVSVDVVDFNSEPEGGLLAHVEGQATGSLGWQRVSSLELKPHLYEITVQGEDWEHPTLTIEDHTEGGVLSADVVIPDTYGHNGIEVNGWRLSLGTAFNAVAYHEKGYLLDDVPPPAYTWSAPDRAWIRPYNNLFTYTEQLFGIGRTGLPLFDVYPIAIVFDRQGLQRANGYIKAPYVNYEHFGVFPIIVRAYDMRDSSAPRQLAVCFAERTGSGYDSTWMPGLDAFANRDLLLVSDYSYTRMDDAMFSQPLRDNLDTLRIMYGLFAELDTGMQDFVDGDTLWILPEVPVSQRDRYILDLTGTTAAGRADLLPSMVSLEQNYPNPFNPTTTIPFALPKATYVKLTVTDPLGRVVRRLIDGEFYSAGLYTMMLDASRLPSGVYFYRLTTGDRVHTRRMLLLR